MAGIAETCTHVAALLFKADAMVQMRERKTVTDEFAYWMLPGSVDKVRPEVGYKIDFTSAAAQKKALDHQICGGTAASAIRTRASTSTTPRAILEDLTLLLQTLHEHSAVCLSGMEGYYHMYKDPVQPSIVPKSLNLRLHDKTQDGRVLSVLRQHCEGLKHVTDVTEAQSAAIEACTRSQHKSPAWFASRAGRITASCMYAVFATNMESPALSTVKKVCYPNNKATMTADMRWGIDHEEEARNNYLAIAGPHHVDLKV